MSDNKELNTMIDKLFMSAKNTYDVASMIRDIKEKEAEEPNKFYQTYLKDCECDNGGIILKDGKAVCRWCRKPYAQGGVLSYKDSHFLNKKDASS